MTTRLDPSECPACGKRVDAATGLTGADTPKPGDISLCWGCAEVLEFDADLSLILCTNPTTRNDPNVAGVRSKIISYRHATEDNR